MPPEPAGTPRRVTVGDGRLPHLRPGARTTKPGSPVWGGAAPPAGGLGLQPRGGRGRAGRDSASPPWAGGGVGYPGRIVTGKLGVRRLSSRGILEGKALSRGGGALVLPPKRSGAIPPNPI